MDFQNRLNHVAERMNAVNGETVTLARGATTNAGVTGSPILMDAEEVIPGVAVTRIEYQAWGVDVADYELPSGTPVVPQVGDTIERSDGTKFRLVSHGGDDPPYQYTTSDRTRFLLHTERVA